MTPKELGNRLKKARRAKKWRTRDLNRLTKINEDYIKDFEDGKFNFLPKPYIRAFLRTLSVTLGLDPEEILEDFEEIMNPPEVFGQSGQTKNPERKTGAKSKKANTKSEEKKEEQKTPPVSELEKSESPNEKKSDSKHKKTPGRKVTETPPVTPSKITRKTETTLVFLVILVLLLAGYIYWKYGRQYFVTEKKPVKEITVFEAKKEILKKEAEKKTPALAPIKTEAPQPRPLQKVSLKIVARDTTWVRVIRDDADTSEYMFHPGNVRKFTADSLLQLKMGRADGLLLWVNGDSVGALGPASQVVSRLLVDRKGIREKKLRGPKPKPKPE